ncbi:MAG: YbhB/YbcL family Raf kinase inhibitor-like protein [Sideroxyarcus sp.]|nr:YbhB/YbcL family Raf kinase inhibitor-like protein [Sideroxyarcus sp.]
MPFTLTSTSFLHNGALSARNTCDGKNVSPPLSWRGVPDKAKSLVLIVDDPDAPDPKAPRMTWVHWLLYNIPPNTHGLHEAVDTDALPPGTLQGTNDWHETGYGGPCPPTGNHRYYFKLFALDVVLPDLKSPTKVALEAAMKGHVIGRTELVGRYQRQE